MGKKKAEKVKKIVKEANESTEYDIKVLALINASDVVVKSVLEIGSAMADTCHDVDDLIHAICKIKGYNREEYWGDYK
tara:strand:+ start:67 stop:300 length:234 start_codon:yes stop_codon:yes gene_type:complete